MEKFIKIIFSVIFIFTVSCDQIQWEQEGENEIIEKGNQCSGTDFHGAVCEDFGFDSGRLSCDNGYITTIACSESLSNFVPKCGNNSVEVGEYCDNQNLNGASCEDFGFLGGTLKCSSSCEFVTSSCDGIDNSYLPQCGNGIIEAGEECDSGKIAFSADDLCLDGYTVQDINCDSKCQLDSWTCE